MGLAATTVLGPMLASVALAADPIVVRPGDTLTGISRRHGVSIEEIVELNRLPDPNRIVAGQRLRLEPEREEAPAARRTSERAAAAAGSHTVRRGEHLTGIARRYGVSIDEIVAANDIANPSRIFAGQRLAIPGAAPARAPRASGGSAAEATLALMDARDDVRRLIVAEAERHGVPATLALAVAWQESGWRQNVVSHAGAIGIMQLIPASGEWVGEAMLGTSVDLRNARQNVRAGVRLLAYYLDRYDGNVDLVLAAYYQGQTAADRHGVYPVSRPYIASIKALLRLLGG